MNSRQKNTVCFPHHSNGGAGVVRLRFIYARDFVLRSFSLRVSRPPIPFTPFASEADVSVKFVHATLPHAAGRLCFVVYDE